MSRVAQGLKGRSLLACGLLATCLGVVATAAALVVATPHPSGLLGAAPLRIGLPLAVMPLADGTRNHTQDGHEEMLLRALAEQLGTTIERVGLAPDEHAEALRAGRVDAVLLRQPAQPPAEPGMHYLPVRTSRGQSVAMRSDTPVRTWDDLAGRRLCTARANVTGQVVASTVAATLDVFDAPAEALIQLRTGGCDAAVFDQAQLQALFGREGWDRFSASLPARERETLVLAVADVHAQRLPYWRHAIRQLDTPAQWDARNRTWAANVALDVFFDQLAPDCH